MGRNFIDITGQIFDRLTAIRRVENNKHGQPQWLCKCICGNEIIVLSSSLIRGNTCSCGCLRTENLILNNHNRRKSKGKAALNARYNQYKQNAIKRDLEWNLTIEQFKILIDGNCHYCGIEPQQIIKSNGCNGSYIGNGIDRIDNNLGYTVENCVSCCKRCNYAKRKMTQKEFLNWIEKVYKYNNI